ncbi:MAG: hypothetical protein WCK65_14060 [Rhodospirillaceae bacterium]
MGLVNATESTADVTNIHHGAQHHEGISSGSARGATSPLIGDANERTTSRSASGRTNFATAGGWVVCL